MANSLSYDQMDAMLASKMQSTNSVGSNSESTQSMSYDDMDKALQAKMSPSQPVSAQPSSDPQGSLISGVSGFNQKVQNRMLNMAGDAAVIGGGLVTAMTGSMAPLRYGAEAKAAITSWEDQQINSAMQEANQQGHGQAFNNGGTVGDVASAIPIYMGIGGVGKSAVSQFVTSNLAQGAMYGATESPNNIAANAAGGAVSNLAVSGGVQAGLSALGAAGKAAGLMLKAGSFFKFKSVDDVVNTAMQNVATTLKGDLTKATPDQILTAVNDLTTSNVTAGKALYKAADTAADSSGIMVSRNGLASLADNLKTSIQQGSTPLLDAQAKAINKALGDNTPITFTKARTLLDSLEESAYNASYKGDKDVSSALMQTANTLRADIQNALPADSSLLKLYQTADQQWAQTVAPFQAMKSADAVKNQIVNNMASQQFMDTLLRGVRQDPMYQKAYSQFPQEVQNNLKLALANSIKEGSMGARAYAGGTENVLDPVRMSNQLQQSLMQNKNLYGSALEPFQNLVDTLKAKAEYNKILPTGKMDTLIVGASILGAMAHPSVGVPMLMQRATFLYKAGKILNNIDARNALKMYSNAVKQGAQPAVKDALQNKIINIWNTIGTSDLKKANILK